MTLSPVFRSRAAVRLLHERGVWRSLAPDVEAQAAAVRYLYRDLGEVLGSAYVGPDQHVPDPDDVLRPEGLHFLQEYFFLVLFRSIFRSLDVPAERLRFYTELNFCVKGTITAADNLFDDQDKCLLPLAPLAGARFRSILQLLCFERLAGRALGRAVGQGIVAEGERDQILAGLLDRMAFVGALEGSEEGGVDNVIEPEVMIERVHRVRGGALFSLAFVAPVVLETGERAAIVRRAEDAVARLGTAFQIVDDLTDFELDLERKSHNLLASQIRHHGTAGERTALARLRDGGPRPGEGAVVERVFPASARVVLERAYAEARAAFGELAALGHWFDPALADDVVRAIVGLDGVARMSALTGGA